MVERKRTTTLVSSIHCQCSWPNNRISALNIGGNLCEDPLKIEEEIIQFFKLLYTKNLEIEAWFSRWSSKSVSTQQAALLEVSFSVEEN